jgi:hypothetical protein
VNVYALVSAKNEGSVLFVALNTKVTLPEAGEEKLKSTDFVVPTGRFVYEWLVTSFPLT